MRVSPDTRKAGQGRLTKQSCSYIRALYRRRVSISKPEHAGLAAIACPRPFGAKIEAGERVCFLFDEAGLRKTSPGLDMVDSTGNLGYIKTLLPGL